MARPSGAKVWIYRFRDPAGKMVQLLIGSFPALSLVDARSEWRNHRAIRDKHGDPSGDVDIGAKTWTHTQGKPDDVSVTPLSTPAVEILRNCLAEEYVFPVRGRLVNQKALSVAFFASRKAGDACPIDHWISHDLRRTTRTGLARLGCPFEIGESILGHRLPGVARVYNVYAYTDEMRKWLNRWAEHVAGIVAPGAKSGRAKRRRMRHVEFGRKTDNAGPINAVASHRKPT